MFDGVEGHYSEVQHEHFRNLEIQDAGLLLQGKDVLLFVGGQKDALALHRYSRRKKNRSPKFSTAEPVAYEDYVH